MKSNCRGFSLAMIALDIIQFKMSSDFQSKAANVPEEGGNFKV
jgi:hypothetical protein